MIQHAILTREELNGAIGRLSRADYVMTTEDAEIGLTPAGATLLREAASTRRSYHAQQEALERRLSAVPWSPDYRPDSASGDEAEAIGEPAFEAAIRAYRPV
jgi:hypothetical protein